MPDLEDLLRSAAPEARPFDEADVVRRVVRRRARRRALVAAAVIAVVASVAGVFAIDDGTDRDVVVDTPEVGLGAPSSLVVVNGTVWLGGDGWVAREDGSGRIDVPGRVKQLATDEFRDGKEVWARGDDWVVAFEPGAGEVVGEWRADGIGDIEPFDGVLTISLTLNDEVAVVRTAAEGIEELWRIPVGDAPDDLATATEQGLWVRNGGDGTISHVDVGPGGADETHPWSGHLLAMSPEGIWATDGERFVDLAPTLLDGGVSVAVGARHDGVIDSIVDLGYGFVTSGPDGVRWYREPDAAPEVLDRDSAESLSSWSDFVVYLVNGDVRRFVTEAIGVWPETTSAGSEAAIARLDRGEDDWRRDPEAVARRYADEELGWSGADVVESEAPGDSRGFEMRAPGSDIAFVIGVHPLRGSSYWVVGSLD